MKKSFIFSLIFILFFSSLLSADNVSTLDTGSLTAENAYVPRELLVKYKTQSRATASSFYKNNWNISPIRTFKSTGSQHVKLPQGMTVDQALDIYRNDPNVEYAEPNYIYHATRTPGDASFDELWGLHNTEQLVNGTTGTLDADIDATEAWDIVTGSDTVIIAVVDSGVKWNHEDLVGNIWSNAGEISGNGLDDDGNGYTDDIRGWDFVDGDNDPMDYNGHGTHVAGTIAAVGDNSLGVTGVCWAAKIMPIRGLDAAGSGTTANLISAIEYANANGAHIINNSWGGGGESSALRNVINASSAVVVCAAGNSNVNTDTTPHYPSSYTSTNIISVAATDQDDGRASFTNYGATSVDVGAPGTDIYSTVIARHDVQLIDDFSAGLGNWSHGGTNDTWGIVSGYLTDSPSGNYLINTNSWIETTTPINLSLISEPGLRLEFRLRGISESNYDILYVFASSNGSSWLPIAFLSGSTNGNWFPMEYDISTYAGGNFYIRFRFISDGSDNYAGWDIDDVKVTAYTSATHNSYDYKDGTSMAAPIVSGITGLIKATTPAITNTQIKAAIEQNVDTIPSLSGWVSTGGRVNANNIFPAAPSVLTATAFSGSQINLAWTDNSSNEDGFRIERKTGAGGTWSQIATVATNTTTYSNTGVSELTNYHYRVCAYHTGVNSPYSNEDDATTPLGAPSSLDASTFSSTEIDLTWADNSNIETGFIIQRKIGAGGTYVDIYTAGANITEYRETALTPLTEYYYRIRAYNGGDNSAYSTEDNATTLDPDAPSGLTATAVSASRINLTWTDSPGEDEFRIERANVPGGPFSEIDTVGQDITEYSNTGLSTSTQYYYQVKSYALGIELLTSNEANTTTHAAPSSDSGGGGGGGGGGGTCFISTAASGL